MAAPSTSLATLRPDLAQSLTEFDLAMDRMGFIGLKVCPVLEVPEQAGTFGVIPVEQLLQNRDTARAPGSGYNRSTFTFTKASYACDENGAEEPIDDRQSKMYRHYFDQELVATERARDAVLRNLEKRIASMFFNTTTFSGVRTTAAAHLWSSKSTGVPLDDVENAVQAVYDNSGLWCNSIIMSRKAFRNCRRTDQIRDESKAQGFMDVRAGKITEAQLATCFDLENVFVAGSSKNGANEGQDVSFSQIWDNTLCLVCHLNFSNDVQRPTVGRTFHWGEDGSNIGGTIETYRDETVRGNVVRDRMDTDEVLIYPDAGFLITAIDS
jgi:hypothetical protein